MSSKKSRLVLMRHAHRDRWTPDRDNGLSEKGMVQAQERVHDVRRFFERELRLWTSPRLRCIETLQPLASAFDRALMVQPLLNERQLDEDDRTFRARIRQALLVAMDDLATSPATLVVCSHGDWLPEAMRVLVGMPLAFQKSHGYALEFFPRDSSFGKPEKF